VTGRRLVVPASAAGRRLDQFLAEHLPDLSRSQVQKLIERGDVTLDDHPARPSERLRASQSIAVAVSAPTDVGLTPAAIPLDVAYEDEDVVVLNKPAGLVVHPAPGHRDDTLVNALMARYPNLAVGQAERPGLVHRLDKGTSGLLVVALTDRAYHDLIRQMSQHQVRKDYLALVHGEVAHERGTIEAPIGRDRRDRQKMGIVAEGREARTGFRVVERFPGYTLLRLTLETGRTHQIRVHLTGVGHPVVGDTVYGAKSPTLGLDRPFLHAWHLGFQLPGQDLCLALWSPLPPELDGMLVRLRAGLTPAP
jgi:23S rRNA pseudouridine1911/1915/1917 synthase